MATFSEMVKQHGSVSAALKANGYQKGSDGTWRKESAGTDTGSGSKTTPSVAGSGGKTSSGGTSGSVSGTSGGSKGSGSAGYYNPDLDYSLEIKKAQDAGASQSYIDQLRQERQNKIDAKYSGVDPYKGTSDIMGKGGSGGYTWKPSATYTEEIEADAGLSQDILDKIQGYREQAKRGLISWDEANQAANALRMAYGGYTVDKKGNQTWVQPPAVEIPSFEEFLDQTGYDQYSEATQQRIQAAVEQAVNNYQAQIDQTNKDTDELARQAYVAKMLGQKNLDQQLSAAGYAGGMADSQRIQTETNYENNLQDIENQRLEVVAELERAIRDAQLTGDLQAAQELQAYLQSMQSSWMSYVQNQQALQNSNYWNQQQMQTNRQQVSAQQASQAYDRAMELLGMGIMPGDDVLGQAGISQQEAEAIRSMVLGQGTVQGASSGGASSAAARTSGSAGSSRTLRGYDNGSLTAEQVRQMQRALGVTEDGMWGRDSSSAAGGLSADEAWAAMNRETTQSTLPDYDTILKNSSAGAYGPQYGLTLSTVQVMVGRNATQEQVESYLLEQLNSGKINTAGAATIMQALGI